METQGRAPETDTHRTKETQRHGTEAEQTPGTQTQGRGKQDTLGSRHRRGWM